MESTWEFRLTRQSKTAVILLFVGNLFYCAGYVAPYWVRNSAGDHAGLWTCFQTSNNSLNRTCPFVLDKTADWLLKVSIFQTGGLFGMLICGLFGISFKRCCEKCCATSCSTFFGLMTLMCAALSFASLFVFYYNTTHMTSTGESEIRYGWSFYFSAVGCSLLVFSSGIFFIAGCRKCLEPPMTTEIIHGDTVMEVLHARSCPYAEGGSLQEPGAVFVKQLGHSADRDQPETIVPS